MVFAIFKVGSALKIGLIRGAHNLSHDAIVSDPYSNRQSAQDALAGLLKMEIGNV